MKKLVFTCALLIGLILNLVGQNALVTPPQASPLKSVELKQLPIQDNTKLRQKELNLRKVGRANHFAIPLEVDINIHKNGTWEYLNNDQAVWRLNIVSKGAYSINLGFTQYNLPDQAKLYLYDPSGETTYGPFTKSDNENHTQFWSPMISGDQLVIEVQTPIDAIKNIALNLSYVNHDYMDFSKSGNSSGSCNVDVACGAEDGLALIDEYREVIQSVGAYTLNGFSQCSGVLINSTKNDCLPYFLTANHCAITNENAATVVVYWNFQNSTCREPGSIASGQNGDGRKNEINSGAILRANWADTDFALIELDDPVNMTSRPFFAGWNLSETLGDSSVCVHHPGVEEKRISFDHGQALFQDGEDYFVRVDNWELGTTEGGSSGAPLFDRSGKILGQLFGGTAACGNQLSDRFGWIKKSWDGGGTPDSRLKDWLDPFDTGVEQLEGKSCQYNVFLDQPILDFCTLGDMIVEVNIGASDNFVGEVTFTIEGGPSGILSAITPNPVVPGNEATILFQNLNSLSTGNFSLNIVGTDSQNNRAFTTMFLQANNEVPSGITLNFPLSSSMNVNTLVNFEWEDGADSYYIEISENSNFNTLVNSATDLTTNNYTIELPANQTYFWRISGINSCGIGGWSEIESFSIGEVFCDNNSAIDLPMQIESSGRDTVTSSLFFDKNGVITDINVRSIIGFHTWMDDLTFTLISPSGTRVVLIDQVCGEADGFNLGFDDEVDLQSFSCPLTDGTIYRPEQPLSGFLGEDPMGQWQLQIIDGFTDDGGNLSSWEIEICADFTSDYSLVPEQNSLNFCVDEIEFNFTPGVGFDNVIYSGSDVQGILNYSFTPNADNSVTATVSNLTNLEANTYDFEIIATEGDQTNSFTINLQRADPITAAPTLVFPPQLATGVQVDPIFEWQPTNFANSYLFELALDIDFIDVLESVNTTETNFQSTQFLRSQTTHFWRVTALNECGELTSVTNEFVSDMIEAVFDLSVGGQISIGPNPASEFLDIDLTDIGAEKEVEISFYSSAGRASKQVKLKGGVQQKVWISEFSNGLYFLRIRIGEEKFVDKIVVIK